MTLIIESEYTTINLDEEDDIPLLRIVLLAGDLNARARLDGALPPEVDVRVAPQSHAGELALQPGDVVVIDLDEHGAESVTELRARFDGRIVGYYSHVNRELGAAAQAAGAEIYPRGAFWKDLSQILS